MNKKTSIIIGIASAVLAVVAILVLFATCFSVSVDGAGAEYGNGFRVIFGSTSHGYSPVPLLIVAFIAECLGFLLSIVAGFMFGKAQGIVFLVSAICLIGGGVLFLFSVQLFRAVNPAPIGAEAITLGAAPITSAIFAFLSGLLCVYGSFKTIRQ